MFISFLFLFVFFLKFKKHEHQRAPRKKKPGGRLSFGRLASSKTSTGLITTGLTTKRPRKSPRSTARGTQGTGSLHGEEARSGAHSPLRTTGTQQRTDSVRSTAFNNLEHLPETSKSRSDARPTRSLLVLLLILGCAAAHSGGLSHLSSLAFGAMLCITLFIFTVSTFLSSTTSTAHSALALMPRGAQHHARSLASTVPRRNLLWSTLSCSLARTTHATTPSSDAAINTPNHAHTHSSAVPPYSSDGSDAAPKGPAFSLMMVN